MIVTLVQAVSDTIWSGLELVTVKFGYIPVTQIPAQANILTILSYLLTNHSESSSVFNGLTSAQFSIQASLFFSSAG